MRVRACRLQTSLGALSGAILTLMLCAPAHAETLPLTLHYTAAPGCPSEATIRDAVEQLVTGPAVTPFAADVSLETEGDHYISHIRAPGGTERLLTGRTCAEVAEAVEVVLALAIRPKTATGADVPAPAISAPTPALAPRVERMTPLRAAARASVSQVGLAAALDWGTLPRVTEGLQLRFGLRAQRWSVDLDGTYWRTQRGLRSGTSSVGGDFSWWTVRPGACAAPLSHVLRVELCLGPEFGRLNGHGVGVSTERDATAFWLAADGWLELGLTLSRHMGASFGLGVAIPVIGRHPFTLDGIAAPIHRPSAVSGRGQLGVSFVF